MAKCGEASTPLNFSDRRRNPMKIWAFSFGFKNPYGSSSIKAVFGKKRAAMEAQRCQAATVGSVSGDGLKSVDLRPFDTDPFDPFRGPVDFFFDKMTFLPLHLFQITATIFF